MSDSDVSVAWIDADSNGQPQYSGEAMRALFSLFLQPGDKPLSAKAGVISGLDTKIDSGQVVVEPGAAVVDFARGSFIFILLRQKRFPVPPPHASYARKDIIVAAVTDVGAGRGGELKLISGTPSSRPYAPSAPTGSLTLAQVDVPVRGQISLSTVAAASGVKGDATVQTLSLSGGARSGKIDLVTSAADARLHVSSVVASGSRSYWARTPTAYTGSGLLRDAAGQFWIGETSGQYFRVLGDPPSGTTLTGVIPVKEA